MKPVFQFIVGVTLLSVSLGYHGKPAFSTEPRSVPVSMTTGDSLQVTQTVLLFLNWYKTHIQRVSQIPLVNQQAGKPYSVNLKNGERYLTYLKSSNLLTNAYLNRWRTFFKERNDGFRMSPQHEGPPVGFDYDLVLLNQDVDQQLASLTSLKIDKVTIVKGQGTVLVKLFDAYEFRLLRRNNRLLINEILNLSQE